MELLLKVGNTSVRVWGIVILMMEAVKSHQEDDEIDDEEFTSTAPYVTSQRGIYFFSFVLYIYFLYGYCVFGL